MRNQQRDFRDAGVNAPARKTVLDLSEEGLEHGCDPAAHHDDIRVEQVDDVAQPRGEKANRLLKNLARERIAGGVSLPDEFAGYRIDVSLGEIEDRGVARSVPVSGLKGWMVSSRPPVARTSGMVP